MRFALLLSGVTTCLALAACSTTPLPSWPSSGKEANTPSAAPRPVQRCNTDGAQWAVGKTNTEHNINEARKRAGAYIARVLRPGQPTTREFNAERLNLEVDATGRIISARCG